MIGIIVFIKNPELGKVKTRLAASVGDQKALEIYIRLLNHTRKILMNIEGVKQYVFYANYIDENDQWKEDVFDNRIQKGTDLGKRMSCAFEEVLMECDKAIIIGSDCAEMTSEHIYKAIKKLNDSNVVIGPSLDGGYYLLGMDHYYPELFKGIEWSTDTVFYRTKSKAET